MKQVTSLLCSWSGTDRRAWVCPPYNHLHMWRSTATHRFPAYDLTGSVRGLVNSTSQLTDTYTPSTHPAGPGRASLRAGLDAFGRQVASTGTCANPYRFGGEWAYYRDPSGLLQLGARFYP